MGSGAVITAAATIAPAVSSLGSSNQFVTPQKVSEYKSIVLHLGSASAQQPQKKKKRNKSSKCLGIGSSMHDHDSSSSLSNIKTSLSMTSLPPDEKQESRDGINAKLKVERPYNSLKVRKFSILLLILITVFPFRFYCGFVFWFFCCLFVFR